MDIQKLKSDPVQFIERFLLLKDTRDYIKLFNWQKEYLRALFSKDKPVKLGLCSACKKVGKTQGIGCGSALFVLFCWDAPTEIYLVSNSAEQSKSLAFSTLSWACEHEPTLAKATTVYRDRIVVNSTDSFIKVLPTKAKSAAGFSPSLCIWDEAHGLKDIDENLWSELTSIQTRRSITLVLSYAGIEGESNLLRRLYDIAMSDKRPDSWLVLWSHDPKISGTIDDAFLESKRLELLPHQYSRLYENRWTSAAGAYIPLTDWENCFDPELKPLPPGAGDIVYLGLDCGLRRDSAVLIGVTRQDNHYNLALFKQWLPGRGRGNEIELESIYEFLLNLHTDSHYNISACWFDPRFLHSIAQRLRAKGVNMIEVSPQPSSVSRCYEFLYQAVKGGRFSHWGEKVLTEHIMNAAALDGPVGIMLEKGHGRGRRIDGAVALSLSLWGASQAIEKKLMVLRGMPETYPGLAVPTSSRWIGQLGRRRSGNMRRVVRMFGR